MRGGAAAVHEAGEGLWCKGGAVAYQGRNKGLLELLSRVEYNNTEVRHNGD